MKLNCFMASLKISQVYFMLILMIIIESNGSDKTSIFVGQQQRRLSTHQPASHRMKWKTHAHTSTQSRKKWERENCFDRAFSWDFSTVFKIRGAKERLYTGCLMYKIHRFWFATSETAMKKMLKFSHKLWRAMFYSAGSFFVHKHHHLHYTSINVMHAPKSASFHLHHHHHHHRHHYPHHYHFNISISLFRFHSFTLPLAVERRTKKFHPHLGKSSGSANDASGSGGCDGGGGGDGMFLK